MRWISPIEGQERVIEKFALFPIRCNNAEVRWLEQVQILQRYSYEFGWLNIKFMKKEKNETIF